MLWQPARPPGTVQLLSFVPPGVTVPRLGAHIAGRVIDLAEVASDRDVELPASLDELLWEGPSALARARGVLDGIDLSGDSWALEAVETRPPVERPRRIFALAGNFVDHVLEGGMEVVPKLGRTPYVFNKLPTSLIGSGASIRIPRSSDAVDYELELCVVIGRRAEHVDIDEALEHVAGYANFNDVSARRMTYPQRTHPTADDAWYDFINGKWCDTFAPCGPFLVTSDELPDPGDLRMTLYVNDEIRQDSNTAAMLFSVPEAVSFISQICPLEPGDLIAMGTPAGTGDASSTYLRPGDVVRGTIEGLGELVSPVEQTPSV